MRVIFIYNKLNTQEVKSEKYTLATVNDPHYIYVLIRIKLEM